MDLDDSYVCLPDLKMVAVDFLRSASGGRMRCNAPRLVAPEFVHHIEHYSGDASTLFEGIDRNAEIYPWTIEIVRIAEDRDLVVTLSRVKFRLGDIDYLVCHWFRFRDGKIAELWEAAQPIADVPVNRNSLF